jgi:hypothetical protein
VLNSKEGEQADKMLANVQQNFGESVLHRLLLERQSYCYSKRSALRHLRQQQGPVRYRCGSRCVDAPSFLKHVGRCC